MLAGEFAGFQKGCCSVWASFGGMDCGWWGWGKAWRWLYLYSQRDDMTKCNYYYHLMTNHLPLDLLNRADRLTSYFTQPGVMQIDSRRFHSFHCMTFQVE